MDRAEIIARLATHNQFWPATDEARFLAHFRAVAPTQPGLIADQIAVSGGFLRPEHAKVLIGQAAASVFRCGCGWQGKGTELAVVKNRVMCKRCGQETVTLDAPGPIPPNAPPPPTPTPTPNPPRPGVVPGTMADPPPPPPLRTQAVSDTDFVPAGGELSATVASASRRLPPTSAPSAKTITMGAASSPMLDAVTAPLGNIDQLAAGTVIAECRIERKVGQGGMGVVYRAIDVHLERPVAIKILSPELLENQTQVSRFKLEAKVLAQLEHPNVVQVYRLGSIAERPFLLMQWIDGESLADRLKRQHGALPLAQAIDLLIQSARGLHAAHEKGVIHRDVKPDNLLITKEGVVKVADFGLAKQSQSDTKLSRTGAFMGTPSYAAPEQIEGQTVTPRTDIYSLGITAYHMLTGRLPFHGESLANLLYHHVATPLPSPRGQNPTIPLELDALVKRMGAKGPQDRPKSMAEVIASLDAIAATIPGAGHSAPATIRVPAGGNFQTAPATMAGESGVGMTVADAGVPSAADVRFDTHDLLHAVPIPAATAPRRGGHPAGTAAKASTGRKIEWWMIAVPVLLILGVLTQMDWASPATLPPANQPATNRATVAGAGNKPANSPPKTGPSLAKVTLPALSNPRWTAWELDRVQPRIEGQFASLGPIRAMTGNSNFGYFFVAGMNGIIYYDAFDRLPERVSEFFSGADEPAPHDILISRPADVLIVHAESTCHLLVLDTSSPTLFRFRRKFGNFERLVAMPHARPFYVLGIDPRQRLHLLNISADGQRIDPIELPGFASASVRDVAAAPNGLIVATLLDTREAGRRVVFYETRGNFFFPLGVCAVAGGDPSDEIPEWLWVNGSAAVQPKLAVPDRLLGFDQDSRHLLVGYRADPTLAQSPLTSLAVWAAGDLVFGAPSEKWRMTFDDPILTAILSHNGEAVFVGHPDGTVRILAAADGREIASLRIGGDTAATPPPLEGHMVFHQNPDGTRLFVGYGNAIYLIDLLRRD